MEMNRKENGAVVLTLGDFEPNQPLTATVERDNRGKVKRFTLELRTGQ
jgi:hypothetical protein